MNNLQKGILFTFISVLAFALVALLLKYVNTQVSAWEKIFWRGVGFFIVGYLMVKDAKRRHPEVSFFGRKENQHLLFMRSIFGCFSAVAFVYVVNHISLADADMLEKLYMFYMLILSAIFLKEKATWVHYLIVLICLPALAMIIKPSFDNPDLSYYLVGISGGVTLSIAFTSVRALSTKAQGEHPATILFHFSIVMTLATAYPTWQNFSGFDGKGMAYAFIALAAVLAAVGVVAVTYSFKFASSKELSVYSYFSLLVNGFFGWLVFDHLPDAYSFAGYAIIVGCGVFLYYYNRALYRAQVFAHRNELNQAKAELEHDGEPEPLPADPNPIEQLAIEHAHELLAEEAEEKVANKLLK